MVRFGGADNRRGDDRFCQEPSERYLSASNASRRGQLGNAIDDRPVNIYGFREEATVSIIGLGANTPIIGIPAQAAAGLGAPRNDADPLRGAEWQHFPLLLAVEQVPQVLQADKAGPAVEIGDAECAGELPRMQANDTIYGVAASVWTRNGG